MGQGLFSDLNPTASMASRFSDLITLMRTRTSACILRNNQSRLSEKRGFPARRMGVPTYGWMVLLMVRIPSKKWMMTGGVPNHNRKPQETLKYMGNLLKMTQSLGKFRTHHANFFGFVGIIGGALLLESYPHGHFFGWGWLCKHFSWTADARK